MLKQHTNKFNQLIIILFLFVIFSNCTNSKNKNQKFKTIKNYFIDKGWKFPLDITDSVAILKFYHDSLPTQKNPDAYKVETIKIQTLFQNKRYIKYLLTKTLIDSAHCESVGFKILEPRIIIDTSDYGNLNEAAIFLEFYSEKYKVNKDTSIMNLPCEDCLLEENGKILKYPSALFFKLNKTKDSLIFSRWN